MGWGRWAFFVCFGLAYKPDVGDVRESPVVKILKTIAELRNPEILVFDPHVHDLPSELTGTARIALTRRTPDMAENDIILLLVAHSEFKNLDFSSVPEERICDEVSVLRSCSGTGHGEPWGLA